METNAPINFAGPWALWQDYLPTAFAAASMNAAASSPDGGVAVVNNKSGIAQINITGPMSRDGVFWGGTSTRSVIDGINKAANDSKVKGILLSINSPGGLYAGTMELAGAINAAKQRKPIVAAVTDVGASAAYWAASQADKIVVNKDAVVGSIGTYSVVYDVSRLADRAGVTVHVVRADKSGEMKGAGTMGTHISDAQLAEMQRLVSFRNNFFVEGVANGRNLSEKQLADVADGRVFTAGEAVSLGLADSVGTLDQAFSDLQSTIVRRTQMSETALSERISQLESACPGADPAFILDQVKRGASTEQAMTAYIAKQNTQISQLGVELDATKKATAQAELAKAALAAAPVAPPAPAQVVQAPPAQPQAAQVPAQPSAVVLGVMPIQSAATSQQDNSAMKQFEDQVNKLRAQGLPPAQAVDAVRKNNAALYEAMMREANPHLQMQFA